MLRSYPDDTKGIVRIGQRLERDKEREGERPRRWDEKQRETGKKHSGIQHELEGIGYVPSTSVNYDDARLASGIRRGMEPE